MPHRRYPPAFFRYLKARLLNLRKPGFWGTAIFLVVVGVVIRESWFNPDAFTHKVNKAVTSLQPNDSSLSPEDKAIAADIDNLPVLLNDSQPIALPATTTITPDKSQANKGKSLLEDIIGKQQSSKIAKSNSGLGLVNDASAAPNPFVLQTENLLRFGTIDNSGQVSSVQSLNASSETIKAPDFSVQPGIESINQTGNSQNNVTNSSLKSALDQSTNQQFSTLNNGTSSQPNSLGQTSYGGVMQTLPSNNLPSQIYSPNTGLNNTTGYIQQTVPNIAPNSYNNLNPVQTLPSQGQSPNLQNISSNSENNLNNVQTLPGQGQPISGTSAVISPAPSNIRPYSLQTPISNVGTPTTPTVYGNYSNYVGQQPTQVPQSYYSIPNQILRQSNGYYYP